MRKYLATTHKDFNEERGYLLPITFSKDLDFIPKRMFVVNNVPEGDVRGEHAHYTTKQFIICTRGCVNVSLDDGEVYEKKRLHKGQSILVPELVWDSQEFVGFGSEIVVLCNTEYDDDDYIHSKTDFYKIINEHNK
jgi:hypothetical protein